MDAQLKKKWLAALRSGNYEQTTGKLRRHAFNSTVAKPVHAYCCLGVLCDIDPQVTWANDTASVASFRDRFMSGALFIDYSKHIELPTEVEDTLIQMNDESGADFLLIADWIEAWL